MFRKIKNKLFPLMLGCLAVTLASEIPLYANEDVMNMEPGIIGIPLQRLNKIAQGDSILIGESSAQFFDQQTKAYDVCTVMWWVSKSVQDEHVYTLDYRIKTNTHLINTIESDGITVQSANDLLSEPYFFESSFHETFPETTSYFGNAGQFTIPSDSVTKLRISTPNLQVYVMNPGFWESLTDIAITLENKIVARERIFDRVISNKLQK